ncbi:MAG: chorismate synthase [Bacteroidaceae bacterium]|nr:chorismate synthase [Bacteroidaceae bacterium]
MNTIGSLFRLTSFGESHGAGIGGVIDGMPAGIEVDISFIQSELARRKPGQSNLTTARNEADEVELLSGIFEGKTTGTPIGFLVRNTNQHSQDYENLRSVFRPSHADFTYQQKYGIRDYRGGGRSSARETISRVVAGAFAKLALRQLGINIRAYTQQVGDIILPGTYLDYNLDKAEQNAVRCPDEKVAAEMAQLIMKVKGEGDTVGGVIACVIKGCPVGLGEPVYDKLQAKLGAAMLSINAVKGFEYGLGFAGASGRGSEQNDIFEPDGKGAIEREQNGACSNFAECEHARTRFKGGITTRTNNSGGIQGGISNGQDIYFRVAFKPVATLLREQETVDVNGNATTLTARGRHDACVLPRAVPVVEAMAAMTILDAYLLSKSTHI